MSALWNWLWKQLFGFKAGKIVLLGLDNAGKTTLMHVLRDNVIVQHTPTQKPTMETFVFGELTFDIFDLGGHTIAQRLWSEYSGNADAIAFIIDTSASDRLSEAKRALHGLLDSESIPAHVPVLVLGNKIDVPGAVAENVLRAELDIAALQRVRTVELYMCSVIKRQGFKEGFIWLSNLMQ